MTSDSGVKTWQTKETQVQLALPGTSTRQSQPKSYISARRDMMYLKGDLFGI